MSTHLQAESLAGSVNLFVGASFVFHDVYSISDGAVGVFVSAL